MARNVIFYGPPGTGKTYAMQKLIEKYTDYQIVDEDIYDAYMIHSEDWLLITLILLQNNQPLPPSKIMDRIEELSLDYRETVSDVLEEHALHNSSLAVKRTSPRIFFESADAEGWFVDRLKLLEFDPNFVTKYMRKSQIAKRYSFVTFHQSFVYEDFIEGIRPYIDQESNALLYEARPGVFKLICEEAHFNPSKQYAILIDEINRGNVSEIFGELISLIEPDKREGQYCELEAILPYSKTPFKVPNNLDIIATMNSADKSIAALDLALRRRFDFIHFSCDYDVLAKNLEIWGVNAENIEGINLMKLLQAINARIELLLDANHVLGHAFFLGVRTAKDVKEVFLHRIIPLLEEYFFDDLQKIQMIFQDLDETGALVAEPIYCHKELQPEELLRYTGDYLLESKRAYFVNTNFGNEAIIKIYSGVSL